MKRTSEDELCLIWIKSLLVRVGSRQGRMALQGPLSIIFMASLSSRDPACEELAVASSACESWLQMGRQPGHWKGQAAGQPTGMGTSSSREAFLGNHVKVRRVLAPAASECRFLSIPLHWMLSTIWRVSECGMGTMRRLTDRSRPAPPSPFPAGETFLAPLRAPPLTFQF